MHRALPLLTALLLVACKGEESGGTDEGSAELSAEATLPPIPEGAHVKVEVGAKLFATAEATTPVALMPATGEPLVVVESLAKLELVAPPDSATMEVVESKGARVRVRSLALEDEPDPSACGRQPPLLGRVTLELWVARDELASVTTRVVELETLDESALKLNPGVVVGKANADGRRLVDVGALVVGKIEKGALGVHWRPTGTAPLEGAPYRDDFADALHYDGLPFPPISNLLRLPQEDNPDGPPMVTLANGCGAFRVFMRLPDQAELDAGKGEPLASPSGAFAVGDDDEDVWGGLTGTEVGEAYGVGGLGLIGASCTPTPEGRSVSEGLTLTSKAGDAIGLTRRELKFHAPPTLEDDEQVCFVLGGLLDAAEQEIVVCAPRAGVGVVPAIQCDDERGGGSPRLRGTVAPGKPKVTGKLDGDIIQRIIQAHVMEVQSCYSAGLDRNDALAGELMINFVITATGKVGSAVVQEATVSDKTVNNCIARAFKRWKFPRPADGGNVIVSAPFVLSP